VRYQARPRAELLVPEMLGAHVWVAVAAFRVSPESLRGTATDQIWLDQENLASIDVGCYVCEQPWSKQISYRGCPGDPSGRPA
jgi:hypothetical protein